MPNGGHLLNRRGYSRRIQGTEQHEERNLTYKRPSRRARLTDLLPYLPFEDP